MVQLQMYPFNNISPMVYYGNFDIKSERYDPIVPTNSSSWDESDSNDIDIGTAHAVVAKTVGATTVDANDGDVSDWYQAAF